MDEVCPACARSLTWDVINLVHRHAKHSDNKVTYLLLVGSSVDAGFERLDLGGDVLEALLVGKPGGLMFLRFGRPVLRLLCWFEGRIFPDSGVGVGVDLLDVGGSNVISEVGRKLLLEPERTC
jgi:hypothetical protein